jgi:hypothetical protein
MNHVANSSIDGEPIENLLTARAIIIAAWPLTKIISRGNCGVGCFNQSRSVFKEEIHSLLLMSATFGESLNFSNNDVRAGPSSIPSTAPARVIAISKSPFSRKLIAASM